MSHPRCLNHGASIVVVPTFLASESTAAVGFRRRGRRRQAGTGVGIGVARGCVGARVAIGVGPWDSLAGRWEPVATTATAYICRSSARRPAFPALSFAIFLKLPTTSASHNLSDASIQTANLAAPVPTQIDGRLDSDFVKLSASSESTGSFSGPGGGVGRSGVG